MRTPGVDGPDFPELLRRFRRDPLELVGRIPGVFPVRKPSGPTSHQVVAEARRRLGLRRIGHAGTLDPLADGLLLLLAGRATRLFDHVREMPKSYRAVFCLGIATDTQDCTGRITGEAPAGRLPLAETRVREALAGYRGRIRQVPPMFSALKKNGRPLYELARAGREVKREPREVEVYALELAAFDGVTGVLEMTVSGGFYVRTLIHDLGRDLGVGAHMSALTRTRIGPFRLAAALELAELRPA